MNVKLTELWEQYRQEEDIFKRMVLYFCYYAAGGRRICSVNKLKADKLWIFLRAYFSVFVTLRRYMYSDCNDLHIISEIVDDCERSSIYFDVEYSFDLASEIVLNTKDRSMQLIIHKDKRWFYELTKFFEDVTNAHGIKIDFGYVEKKIKEFGLLQI